MAQSFFFLSFLKNLLESLVYVPEFHTQALWDQPFRGA